ncbi:MAG TPA: PDZ domain-containing protein, partial [Gemmatimonadaceae bacterium]|nr:PDZ domain-containing protein [Gemmatimonadaceae bacterium]
ADMAGNVIGVVNAPGRTHFSLTEMSMLAPLHDGAVSLDPVNRQNTFVSYYPWGATVALALDLTLRERFDLTLDDYMRALWRGFGRFQTPALAPARPYTGRDARRTLGTLVRDTAFANDFFRRHVDGREVPDFGPLLAPAGFLFAADSAMRPWLGASLDDDTTAVFVNSTGETGSLFRAGIANGDRIHAVDGTAVTTVAALDAALTAHRVGDVVQLDVTQRGGRRTIPVTLVGRPTLRLVTYEKSGLQVTDAMREFRRRWLESGVARTSR